VLPSTVIVLFLLWSSRLSLWWNRRLSYSLLIFLAVAAPWYIWVTVDTKASFIRGFIFEHNLGRYLSPMESHHGPIFYYLLAIAIGLAPWSVFLWSAVQCALGKRARRDYPSVVDQDANLDRSVPNVASCDDPESANSNTAPIDRYRFLWTWIVVYLLFFSLAGTKLPNYILPVYAPIAILIGRCLDRWRTQAVAFPAWRFQSAFAGLFLIGAALTVAAVLVSAGVAIPATYRGQLQNVQHFGVLGLPLIFGSAAAWWCFTKGYRNGVVGVVAGTAACFIGPVFAWADPALNAMKAPRELIDQAQARRLDADIRVACYDYFQPSMVFYSGREVKQLATEDEVSEFLRSPLEVYLFLPMATWERVKTIAPRAARQVADHADLFRRCEVVVVTNR
jgi:4-amino-4-deoxy-L-arabinose transferase-like glycosyltransferase